MRSLTLMWIVVATACSSPGSHADRVPPAEGTAPVAAAVPGDATAKQPLDDAAVIDASASDAAAAAGEPIAAPSHSDPGCPAAKPSRGDACGKQGAMNSMRCDYGAQTCVCQTPLVTYCGGRNPGLLPPVWTCAARTRNDGCPALAPSQTSAGKPACDTPDQRC